MKTLKRLVTFKDAENNKVVFDAEITDRNGYFEFSASGDYCGGMGQCFDEVKPANEDQTKLIDLWRNWHLNGMNAGTDKQMKLTDGFSYDESLQILTNINRETGKETNLNYKAITRDI